MTPGARIPLTADQRTALIDYLDRELDEALVVHSEREDRLAEWDRLYLAEPKQQKKTFPWDGAANLVIPLIGTTVDSVVARLHNTIFSVEPFWTVRPLHKDFVDQAGAVEDFLDWSRRVEFDLYGPVKAWTIEVVKYGWSYLKPRWEVATKPFFTPNPDGTATRQNLIQRRAVVDHVMVQDVVTQAAISDESQAEWIAHRFRLTDGAVRWRTAEKVFDLTQKEVDDLLRQKEDAARVREMGAASPDQPLGYADKLNTFYEIWGDLPIGKDPKPIPVCLTYHKPTRTLVRAIYNPYYYGFRPLLKGTFITREGRGEGLGICQMLAHLQDEWSTIHNQSLDNATLANTRFFAAKRGAVRPGTKIWPGRVLLFQNPADDIRVMQLGDVYPSARALEVGVQAIAERRSGVSDPQLGRESTTLGSRATATGTLALIQEGNRRFDLNVRDLRDTLGQVGKIVLQLNQQFRPKGVAYFVQGDDGALTEATLDLPTDYIEHSLGVELTASTATINREVEKQGLIALSQLQQQYGQEILGYAQIVANPQLPPPLKEQVMEVATARTTLMRRIMHAFDQKDNDELAVALMSDLAAEQAAPPPGADPNALPPGVDGTGPGDGGPGAAGPGGPGGGADQLAGQPGLGAPPPAPGGGGGPGAPAPA